MTPSTKFYNATQILFKCGHVSKFGNSSILRKNLNRKTDLFKGWSWFKFNNVGLVLGIVLKIYSSVAKELELKTLRANSYVWKYYRENTAPGGVFAPHPDQVENFLK